MSTANVTYYERKEEGRCTLCGGYREQGTPLECPTCRAMTGIQHSELGMDEQVERWKHMVLHPNRLEKLYSFICKGGKIQPKEAKL